MSTELDITRPVIWTINGNVNEDTLTYRTRWDITDTYYKFVEQHVDADGNVVKESAHVYDLRGLSAEGAVSGN